MPTEYTAQARWEGWTSAMRFLEKASGTLWIVSPFITTTPSEQLIQGARVLTKLKPEDLASGATKASAIRHLIEGGADVRVLSHLHAKVFLRMRASQAVGFSGSANLTKNGSDRNHEVMTGPETFSSAFIHDLTERWRKAESLSLTKLAEAQAKAERLKENDLARQWIEADVVVIALDVQMLGRSFDLTESRVGVPLEERTKGLRPARVDFIKAEDRKLGNEIVTNGLKKLRNGRSGKVAKLTRNGEGRTFAVPVAERDNFQDGIEALNQELQVAISALAAQHHVRWKADFLKRIQQAAQRYVKADPERVKSVLKEADERFDAVMERLDVGLSYSVYLPLHVPSRPLAHDFRRQFRGVRENQTLQLDEEN